MMLYCLECAWEAPGGDTVPHAVASGHRQFTQDPYIAWLTRGIPEPLPPAAS